MLFFLKNKTAFIALTLLSSYSLMQGAFARLQSVRPVVSAIAGLRPLTGYSRTDADQVMRMWESRQKELDALGGIPKKVQDAAHIISRNDWRISPAIHLMKRYGAYDITASQRDEIVKSMTDTITPLRVKIVPAVEVCLNESIKAKLEEIVSTAGVEAIRIVEAKDEGSFFMGADTFKKIVGVGPSFSQFLQGTMPREVQGYPVHNELCQRMNFELFAGVFLHELGHVYHNHFLILEKISREELVGLPELRIIGRHIEQEADAFVASYKNLSFLEGIYSFFEAHHRASSDSETRRPLWDTEESLTEMLHDHKNFNRKEVALSVLASSHPEILERMSFFKRELAYLRQQEAVKK